MNDVERQRCFHRRADASRLRNRLENPWIVRRERLLATRLAAFCPPGGRVLEVGCGEGTNLAYLAKACPETRLFGLDFSETKTAFAADHLPAPGYVCANALALPFASGLFDCVFCRDLLHHVDFNRSGVLAEMLRLLAPDGTAVILECRGLVNSSAESLQALGAGRAHVRVEFVEASVLTRALGFTLGWDAHGRWSFLKNVFYAPAHALECLLEQVLPRRYWAMMLAAYRKTEAEGGDQIDFSVKTHGAFTNKSAARRDR